MKSHDDEIRTLFPVAKVTGWQPIETAPKDRKIILFYPRVRFSPARQVFGMWCADEHANNPKPYWANDLMHIHGKAATRKNQPTHWMMPLDDPNS